MGGSLSDISKMTGLGITTVSEILRDKPGYREKTRAMVLEAAQQLNYRPNLMARGLKSRRSMTIGIIVGAFHSLILVEKLSQLVRQAKAAGYVPFVLESASGESGSLLDSVNHLLDRQVDGLIMLQTRVLEDRVIERLQSISIPTVFVGWAPQNWPWHVRYDMQTAMRQAMELAASHGHTRAMMVRSPSDVAFPRLKHRPWMEAAQSAGIEVQVSDDFTYEPASSYMERAYEMFSRHAKAGTLPGLVLMNNDPSALAAIAALRDAGVSVPEDISVIGFDDTHEALYCRPGLTTIRQPRSEVGQAVLDLLFKAMNRQVENQVITLPYRLMVRQSVGPVPARLQA